MIEPVNNEQNISENQMRWQASAEKIVQENGEIFDKFIKAKPELLELTKDGDGLISMRETTGYNLVNSSEQMDLMKTHTTQ